MDNVKIDGRWYSTLQGAFTGSGIKEITLRRSVARHQNTGSPFMCMGHVVEVIAICDRKSKVVEVKPFAEMGGINSEVARDMWQLLRVKYSLSRVTEALTVTNPDMYSHFIRIIASSGTAVQWDLVDPVGAIADVVGYLDLTGKVSAP